MDEVNYITENN